MIGVDGGISPDVFRGKTLQDPRGVAGVRERVVEFLSLLNLQIFNRPFEGSALFPIFMYIGKDLLDIPVEKWKRERPASGQISVINVPADISLQLGQVAGTPGAEDGSIPAPDKKVCEDMRKRTLSFEVALGHVDHAAGHIMKLPVQDRPDGLVEGSHLLQGRIELYRPDLNDLKGQLRIFSLLSVRTLVPLQIQNDIVQLCNPFQSD